MTASLRNVWAVTLRELRSYFVSPLAYVVTALFLVVSGLLFAAILASQQEATLRGMFQNVSVIFLFIIPAITMRLLAEEQATGTIELLLTNPVREWEVVVGKYLGGLVVVLAMIGLTLVYAAFLFAWGNPEQGPLWAGYLGLVVQAAAFLSIGLFASSLTGNQIIAAVLAFVLLLVLWLADAVGQVFAGSFLATVFNYLSVTRHFNTFPSGVINAADLVFFFTLIGAGLALSTLSLQTRRFR